MPSLRGSGSEAFSRGCSHDDHRTTAEDGVSKKKTTTKGATMKKSKKTGTVRAFVEVQA